MTRSDGGATNDKAPSRTSIDVIEIVAALCLGLAAIAIGWSTYQSALWGGRQDEAYTESVREASNAVDLLQAADTTRALDQSLYVEILTSGVCDTDGDRLGCERLLASMSTEGAAAIDEWFDGGGSDPFASPSYVAALYGPGEAAREASDRYFAEAGEANQNGDDYELAATILTAVLFFAGIAAVLHDDRIQWALLAVAGVLFLGAAVWTIGLPVA